MATPQPLPLDALLVPDGLSAANRQVFDYWQSLRRDGALPKRADFNPARIRPALARLCLIDVKPGEYVTCRLAGSAIRTALGVELSGMDYRRYTSPHLQADRLRAHETIVSGLAMRNARRTPLTTGRSHEWQELLLPFGDVREDGSRQVLCATDFGPLEYGERATSVFEALGAPQSFAYFRI